VAVSFGIVGLPNAGKSTLFNALTRAGAEVAPYPFCTVDRNMGAIPVPDHRLERISQLSGSRKALPTTLNYVDIAGLVKGASKGEGLGNQFLSHIREVDAIVHVVRCFTSGQVSHVHGEVDPVSDVDTVELELALADLLTVERRIEKARIKAKSGEREHRDEVAFLEDLAQRLNDGELARYMAFNEKEQQIVDSLFLLTAKPTLFVANATDLPLSLEEQGLVNSLRARLAARGERIAVVAGKMETELNELGPDEAQIFLSSMETDGVRGTEQLIREGYDLMGLVTFFTANENECRAWTIREGTPAVKAAGRVHTDMEKGFIRAEVVAFTDLDEIGSFQAIKEKGILRVEGRDYVVRDGDILYIRFAV